MDGWPGPSRKYGHDLEMHGMAPADPNETYTIVKSKRVPLWVNAVLFLCTLAFSFYSPPKVGAFVQGTSCTAIQNSPGQGYLTGAIPLVGVGMGTKKHVKDERE